MRRVATSATTRPAYLSGPILKILTVLIFIGVGIVFAILEGVLDSRWLSFALNIVLQTVTAPFLALAWTITYYELRDLKGAEPTAAV